MQTKSKSPRLLAQPGAKGVNQKWTLEDASIIRAFWRAVKRFAAAIGCIYCALALLLFVSAWIEGDFSVTGTILVSVPAAWLCRLCYRVAAGEETLDDDEDDGEGAEEWL